MFSLRLSINTLTVKKKYLTDLKMILIPNYLNSQTTLVITKDLCYLISTSPYKLNKIQRFKLDLLMKHNRWVSQVALN